MNLALDKPLCFFDLETTGINIVKDRIVEIGIVKLYPEGKRESKSWRVNPQVKIPSEASEWKKTNASDPNVKNMAGGQGSLYDEDTGFLIFKSRDLKPGHVEPRPKGEGVGNKTPKNWDLLYSKTHNADGTPKTQE